VRVAIAALACLAVLAGSAVAVAETADTSGADRARMVAILAETTGEDCDCTAGTRAKERIENGLASAD
jgi:hypothetical protein